MVFDRKKRKDRRVRHSITDKELKVTKKVDASASNQEVKIHEDVNVCCRGWTKGQVTTRKVGYVASLSDMIPSYQGNMCAISLKVIYIVTGFSNLFNLSLPENERLIASLEIP